MKLGIALSLATALLWLLPSGFALAQPFEAYLDLGAGRVIVWKDQAAMDKGKLLMDKDPKEAVPLVVPLVACIVPSGTKVQLDRIKASSGWSAAVLEGEFKGCQGVVGGGDFKTAGERQKTEQAKALAGCAARFGAWVAKQPPGATNTNKLDIDRAIGQGCFDLLNPQLQQAKERAAQRERAAQPLSPATQAGASQAIQTLKQLRSATQAGLTYREYGTRLVNAQIAIDQHLEGVEPSGAAVRAIRESMDYYRLAGQAWETKIQGQLSVKHFFGRVDCTHVQRLASAPEYVVDVEMVPALWACGSDKLAEADALLRR